MSLNVLPNALDLWHKYKHTIVTDISDVMIPGFAKLAIDIPQDRISALSLGPCTTPLDNAGRRRCPAAVGRGVQRSSTRSSPISSCRRRTRWWKCGTARRATRTSRRRP